MLTSTPKTFFLKDYAVPAFLVASTDLDIDLREDHALVKARMVIARNPAATDRMAPLRLDGDELELVSLRLDGKALDPGQYTLTADCLEIAGVPDRFTLETVVRIHPEQNTKLMGFYASKDGYFTQCEAEGFRRITFFPRPSRRDVALHHDHARRQGRLSLFCSRTAIRLRKAKKPADATGRSGWTPFPSPLTCSRWSPRNSTCSKTPSSHVRGARVARDLRRAGQARPVRLRDGGAEARDEVGRGGLRPGARPRPVHDRRGRRLQHGRDGEQGPQHLQHQVRARPRRTPPPTSTS